MIAYIFRLIPSFFPPKMCNRLLQRLRLKEWGPLAEGPFLLNVHDIGAVRFLSNVDTMIVHFFLFLLIITDHHRYLT